MIFCIIGIFIPGFTAILLLGIQMFLAQIGIECTNAWKLIWGFSWIGLIFLPVLFYKNLKKKESEKYEKLKTNLIFFNLFEYIFLQAGLSLFFTKANTLCYVSDGQNGLELAFTGWLALPILMGVSYLFEYQTNTIVKQ